MTSIPEPEPTTLDKPKVRPNPRATGERVATKPTKPRGPIGRAFLGPETAPKPPRETPLARRGTFERPLTELYVSIGTVIMPFDQICGGSVIQQAPACAKSLDELAYQNEAVRRALVAILETSAWGAVIAAHLPIMIAVMMHHSPAMQERMTIGFGDIVENVMRREQEKEQE